MTAPPIIANPLNPQALEPAWYCIRSKTKTEHAAARQLAPVDGVEVFCPRIRFRKNTRRGPVWFVEALFPGYFFARFVAHTHSRLVSYSPGVTGLVTFGDGLTAVPENDIRILQSLMDASGLREVSDTLVAGSETEILTGPFRGLQVVVRQVMPAKERVKILMEILGTWREVEIHRTVLAVQKPLPSGLER